MRASSWRLRLNRPCIYLIASASPVTQPLEVFVRSAVSGGVGMLQLREKQMTDLELLTVAQRYSAACKTCDIPFIVNDRLDIALACGAEGVHLGQDDMPAADARKIAGEHFIIGLSTHTPEQIEAAARQPVDYIGVGPIWETPTKPGRPPVGVELVRYATEHARQPFFAIGGIDAHNAGAIVEAGARGISVARWISMAADPAAAAASLSACIERARPAAHTAGTSQRG